MSRLSPQLLIVTCNSLVAAFERRSRLMRALAVDLTFTPEIVDGVPGKSWDVAFIDHCGYWSHFDERSGTSAWPVPEGLDVRALGMFGAEAGLLRDDPEEGDIPSLRLAPERLRACRRRERRPRRIPHEPPELTTRP